MIFRNEIIFFIEPMVRSSIDENLKTEIINQIIRFLNPIAAFRANHRIIFLQSLLNPGSPALILVKFHLLILRNNC